jgi:hypothetical protein
MPNGQPLAVSFTATYRASGYDQVHADALRMALRRIGPARVRPLHLPEAGGSTEVSLVLSFIGASLASGLIYDTVKGAVASVREWFAHKKTRYGIYPEIIQFAISLDELDIELVPSYDAEDLTYPDSTALACVPQLITLVQDHFSKKAIDSHGLQLVRIAVNGLTPSNFEQEVRARPWIVRRFAPFPTDSYDPALRRFTVGLPERASGDV